MTRHGLSMGGARSGSPRAKGQVFSIDAMLSLLPMMMIVGAALQYAFLASEQTQILAQDSALESKMQLLAGSVVAQYQKDARTNGNPLDCDHLGDYVGSADSLLGSGYAYDVRVGQEGCVQPSTGSAVDIGRLDNLQNPAASGSRMMLYAEEGSEPKILEVHFTVWEDI